jgi:hypothetical protein
VAVLDELVPLALLDDEDEPLPDGVVSVHAAPVHDASSPAHAATRKLPAAESKKPSRTEERGERNKGVDITNSNQSMIHKGFATPQQADAPLRKAFENAMRSPAKGSRQIETWARARSGHRDTQNEQFLPGGTGISE